jgi:hypothetical protein
MTNQSKTPRWIPRTALGAAVALCAVLVLSVVVDSWGQAPSQARPPSTKGAKAAEAASVRDELAPDSNGLEILEAQIEAKRTLANIDESRAEQAKRWRAYYEKLVRDGRVIEDRALAARDDVLMLEAHVVAERAELKAAEIRLKSARRHAAQGGQAAAGDQAREELDVLETLIEAKRALLKVGESRVEQARRTQAHYEKLFRGGLATEDLVLAAKDDVLLMDSALAWARADLKVAEMRVRNAKRFNTEGGPSVDATSRRLAESEDRLAMAEMKADLLQHEVARLRRELPHEARGFR